MPGLSPDALTGPNLQHCEHIELQDRTAYLCKRTRPIVLNLIVSQIQLSKHGALCRAQTTTQDDGPVVAEAIATQVQL